MTEGTTGMTDAKPTPGPVKHDPNFTVTTPLEHTPGPCEFVRYTKRPDYLPEGEDFSHIGEIVGRPEKPYEDPYDHPLIASNVCEHDAQVLTEAIDVASETGLTPRQLAEQRAALLEALKALSEAIEHPMLRRVFGDIEDASVFNNDAVRLFELLRSWFDVRDNALSKATTAIATARGSEREGGAS